MIERSNAVTATRVTLMVNGERLDVNVDSSRSLLDVLREDMGLTGAKRACDDGECGSCIVLLGKKGVMSCLLPVSRAQGKEITTIEGLALHQGLREAESEAQSNNQEKLHPLQYAFIDTGASQCGFCIPRMIMETTALLNGNANPAREDVVKRLSRNLCRCTGYVKIIDAVLAAAEFIRDGKGKNRDGTGYMVGQSPLRLDARDKVTGQAKYAADLSMDGMLYAKVLRSPHHHASIVSIDTSEAEAMPGVQAVVTANDIPGKANMPSSRPQISLFAQDKVRFMGEVVAAVAAVSEEIAAEAGHSNPPSREAVCAAS